MDKHVTLVGILNIVYRSLVFLLGGLLLALSIGFEHLFDALVQSGHIHPGQVPIELLDVIPIILLILAAAMILISVVGIVAAAGVLKKKEWARVVLLVISFFNLVRIPLGTVLGAYSIWVLMSDETIRLFTPTR